MAPRRASRHANREHGKSHHDRLRSDRHRRRPGHACSASGGGVIEVRLAAAVVRVASCVDDAAQLTVVLRAIRASASKS
jgi:hypothetical protein